MDDKQDADFWLYPYTKNPLWEAIYDENGQNVPGCFHTIPAQDYDLE